MTDSLSGVTTMQITYAARNSDFEGRDIHEGEYLALYNGALLGNSPDLDSLLAAMAEKAAGEGKEFVNIFYGADPPPSRPRTRPKSSPKPFPLPKSMSSPAASPSTTTSSPPNNRVRRKFPRHCRGGRLCPPFGKFRICRRFSKKADFSAGGQRRPPLRFFIRFRFFRTFPGCAQRTPRDKSSNKLSRRNP